MQGHTDNQGEAAANQQLSQRRAASVVAYLVGKGIAADRLVARGFRRVTSDRHERHRRRPREEPPGRLPPHQLGAMLHGAG